jgi:hypothetical protein
MVIRSAPSGTPPPNSESRPVTSADDYVELSQLEEEETGNSKVILSLSYKHPWLSGAFYTRSLNQMFLIQPQLSIHSPSSQVVPLCKQSNIYKELSF